jgi:hypothetical protein
MSVLLEQARSRQTTTTDTLTSLTKRYPVQKQRTAAVVLPLPLLGYKSITRPLKEASLKLSSTAAPRIWRDARLWLHGSLHQGHPIVLIVGTTQLQQTMKDLFPAPSPISTLLPGANVLYWEYAVPWGTLQVDGHPSHVLRKPCTQTTNGPPCLPSFTLPPGRHTLVYRSAPFPTLQCVLSVPAATTDTYPLDQVPGMLVGTNLSARLLNFEAILSRLSPPVIQQLIGTIEATLRADARSLPVGYVMPGERYLKTIGKSVIATQRLQARLLYPLNVDPASPNVGFYPHCVTLCDENPYAQASSLTTWLVITHVVVQWSYTSPSGRVVVAQAPSAPVSSDEHVGVDMAVQWQGGTWRAQLYPLGPGGNAQPICLVSGQILDRTEAAISTSVDDPGYSWDDLVTMPGPNCVWVGSNAGDASAPVARLLYRFGVLLAANQEGHHLFPELPMSTASEQIFVS